MSTDPFGTKDTHPSYGMVGFSRCSVGGSGRYRLFGSAIAKHYNIVMLRIYQAEQAHELCKDWNFSKGSPIVEVEMSEAQFASLLTTMNIGDGVPCTIRYRQDTGAIKPPPDTEIEAEKVRKGFEKNLSELSKEFKELENRAKELFSAPRMTKAERDELLEVISKASRDLNGNFGFVVDQFSEATERVVTQAKAEVDAFVSSAARITGIERLKELASNAADGGALRLTDNKTKEAE